jgi:transcriptional regulator GlxA family with amidase domain
LLIRGGEDVSASASRQGTERVPLSIGFILLPRFTLLPFAAFIDCLRLAADEGDSSRQLHCRWTVMGSTGSPVRSSCGIEITPWEEFADPGRFDYIVVVGGLLSREPPADAATVEYLRRAASKGVALVGLCTGPFALIQAGLMKGRRCCVSWYHYYDLMDRFPDVTPVADQLFVVDGNRITCAGGAAAADLAAWVVERHRGRTWAQKSLHIMLIDHARRGSNPQPQPPLYEQVEDNRVRRAILLIEQHLSEPLGTEEIAAHVNVSRRQLERAFNSELGMSPHQFARELRLRYGLWLLRNTDRSITEIGSECGFADTAHFSRQFRAHFGKPPSQVREEGQKNRTGRSRIAPEDPADDIFERAWGTGGRSAGPS